MQLNLEVRGTLLKTSIPYTINKYMVGYDTCKFGFDNSWKNYSKVAVFGSDTTNKIEVMLENDTCLIPWENLVNEGYLYIGVYGVKGETLIPTNFINIKINKGAYAGNSIPSEPTLGVQAQMVEKIGAFSHAEEIRQQQEIGRVQQANTFNTNETARKQAELQRKVVFDTHVNSIDTDYHSLKTIMLDENNAANLQNQVNGVNTQLQQNAKQLKEIIIKGTSVLKLPINYHAQGFVKVGSNFYVRDFVSNSSPNNTIKKFNNSGELLATYVDGATSLGHINDLTYYPEANAIITINQSTVDKVTFLSANELTVIKTSTLPISPVQGAYDSVAKQFAMSDGTTGAYGFLTYEYSTDKWHLSRKINPREISGQMQGLDYNDGYIYQLMNDADYRYDYILRFNKTGTLADIWILDYKPESSLSEAQGMTIEGDDIYVIYNSGEISKFTIPTRLNGQKSSGFTSGYRNSNRMQEVFPLAPSTDQAIVDIYVSNEGSDSAGDGSPIKPYKTLHYAINKFPVNYGCGISPICNLYVMDNANYTGFTYRGSAPVNIYCNNGIPSINSNILVEGSKLVFLNAINFNCPDVCLAIKSNGFVFFSGNYTVNFTSAVNAIEVTLGSIISMSGGVIFNGVDILGNLIMCSGNSKAYISAISGTIKTLFSCFNGSDFNYGSLTATFINFCGGITNGSKYGTGDGYNIETGSILVTATAGSFTDYQITFNKNFNNTPMVYLSLDTGSTDFADMTKLTCVATSRTKTGFTIRVYFNGITQRMPSVLWLALG